MQRRSWKITVREFSVLFLIISLITFIGFTGIHADENETENNNDIVENGENETDDTEASFQNSAQEQHANNVASRAALNNETVAELIAKAEETGEESDITAAEEALATEIGVLTDEIAAMRGDDMGWGQIAQHFGLHPSILSLGHSKAGKGKETSHFAMHNFSKSEMAEATARGHQISHSNNHELGGKSVGGKGIGLAHSKGNSGHPGKGLALGHGKGAGSGDSVASTGNHGNGHGNGPGGGHGGGHGGGNGGGNGGGHK